MIVFDIVHYKFMCNKNFGVISQIFMFLNNCVDYD